MTTPAPLTQLPTKLIWDIHDLLSLQEVRNLRLMCRWLEHETSTPFINRFYQELAILDAEQSTKKVSAVLACPQFAAAVKILHVDYLAILSNTKPWEEGYTLKLKKLRQLLSRDEAPVAELPVVSDIMTRLPCLQVLSLRGLTDGLQPSKIAEALCASGVSSLTLRCCELRVEHLESLLKSRSRTLRKVLIGMVGCCEYDAWLRILGVLHEMPTLQICDLENLTRGPTKADNNDHDDETATDVDHHDRATTSPSPADPSTPDWPFHFVLNVDDNPSARRYKWLRNVASDELDHYWMQMTSVKMRGQMGVKAGLELILRQHGAWRE